MTKHSKVIGTTWLPRMQSAVLLLALATFGEAWAAKPNQAPTVSITAPANGATFAGGSTVTLAASASDSDGTIAKVEYFRGGTTLLGTATTTPYTIAWTNVAAGSYALTAKATDNGGATKISTAVNITVTAPVNNPPAVAITSPSNGAGFTAPATIAVAASASDTDGTVSKVEFFAGATLIGTVTGAPFAMSWTGVSAGSYTLTAKATDNLGATRVSAAVAITVGTANLPPLVVLTVPEPCSIYDAPVDIVLAADAVDLDGGIAAVDFYEGSNLIGSASTAPYTILWTNPAPGTYTLTAKAIDNRSASAVSAPVTVTVGTANQPPIVAMTSPAPGASFVAPANIALSATASDPDGSIARIDFYNGAVLLGSSLAPPFTFAWTDVPTGAYSLTAKATDNRGRSTTCAAVNISVTNLLPSVALTAPAIGATFVLPATIALAAAASDTDGSVSRVDFLANGSVLASLTSPPYVYGWDATSPGSYTLAARATDNAGGVVTSAPVAVTLRNNAPPVVALTSPANGSGFDTPSSITISATASDVDGSIARVDLLVDGKVVASPTSAPYSYAWTAPPTGTYGVQARATDDRGASTSTPTATIAISGPPAVSITSPADGAAFVAPASIAMQVSAAALPGTIAKLDFFDGASFIGTIPTGGSTVSATFTYGNVPAGARVLTVRATDSGGRSTTSAATTVNVGSLPVVALTNPLSGTAFTAPAVIALVASASTANGAITLIEFFNGASLIGTATVSPYQFSWISVGLGTYSLTARATNSAGLKATSAPVTVTVAPTAINVANPTDGSTLYQTDVVVSGTFSGITPTSIVVAGRSAKVGTRSFSAVVPLQPGANPITVTAITPGGNVTRTFNVTRAEPSIAITNVTSGQTINDDTVTLVGSALAPPNSAVAINGRLAPLAPDGTFFVNNLPLVPGANSIAVSLNTPEIAAAAPTSRGAAMVRKTGTSPDKTIDLTRNGSAPFTLEIDSVEGFAPLTVNVRLVNRLIYVYDDLTIDIDGDGRIDYAERGLPIPILERQFTITYDTPGVYPLTLTLTRQGGSEIIYQATRMVNVQSVAQAAHALRSIFIGLLDRLSASDLATAAQYLTNTIRQRYGEAFGRLAAVLPVVVENIGTIEDAIFGDGYAELTVTRPTADGVSKFSILMIRDGDGLWRVDGM